MSFSKTPSRSGVTWGDTEFQLFRSHLKPTTYTVKEMQIRSLGYRDANNVM